MGAARSVSVLFDRHIAALGVLAQDVERRAGAADENSKDAERFDDVFHIATSYPGRGRSPMFLILL